MLNIKFNIFMHKFYNIGLTFIWKAFSDKKKGCTKPFSPSLPSLRTNIRKQDCKITRKVEKNK